MITASIVEVRGFGRGQAPVNIYQLSEPVTLIDQVKKTPYQVTHIQVSHSNANLAPTVAKTLVTDFDFPTLQPNKWDNQVGSNAKEVPLENAMAEFLEWANNQKATASQ